MRLGLCKLAFMSGSLLLVGVGTGEARSDPLLGEVTLTSVTFCPKGFVDANGDVLPIASNQSLFALYGTRFGGNGVDHFGVPDLRGRTPVHNTAGQANPPHPIAIGENQGGITAQLLIDNMPAHSHTLEASTQTASLGSPAGADLGELGAGIRGYSTGAPGAITMATDAVGITAGRSGAFSVRQPYLAMRFCISTTGAFPVRN